MEEHWRLVKRILRYISGTLNYGLLFTKSDNLDIVAFCDVDFGRDPDDRRSTIDFCVYLESNLVNWEIKSRLWYLANAIAEISWLKSLLSELGIFIYKAPVLHCDNLSTVLLSENPILHSRTKHIELDIYFVREKFQQGLIQVCLCIQPRPNRRCAN